MMSNNDKEKRGIFHRRKQHSGAILRRQAQEGNLSAPIKLVALITVVERRRSEYYMDLIQSYGVNLQYVTKARKLSEAGIVSAFGLDEELSAVISIVRLDTVERIAESLEKRFLSPRYGPGEAVVIPLSSVIGKTVFGFLAGDATFSGPTEET